MVPGTDGSVRKLRFSMRKALLVALCLTLLLSLGLFVAGDYTRVQILRWKTARSLDVLAVQRDRLLKQKAMLESEVSNLEFHEQKTLDFTRGVRTRMSELASILQGATDLIPVEAPQLDRASDDGEDVGGAEIECRGECLAREKNSLLKRLTAKPTDGPLLDDMDALIGLLRSMPLGYPANGHVSSHFGLRKSPFGGGVKLHQGLDISLSFGSYIYATANGTVIRVRRTPTYGLVADIDHGNGIVTRYAHMSRGYVSAGEKICAGEIVGLAGSSGHSTGPHLHYEVRVDNKPVDPQALVRVAVSLREMISGHEEALPVRHRL